MVKEVKAYNNALLKADKDIAKLLAEEIDKSMPEAENKIWHRHPVWFLEGNPVFEAGGTVEIRELPRS